MKTGILLINLGTPDNPASSVPLAATSPNSLPDGASLTSPGFRGRFWCGASFLPCAGSAVRGNTRKSGPKRVSLAHSRRRTHPKGVRALHGSCSNRTPNSVNCTCTLPCATTARGCPRCLEEMRQQGYDRVSFCRCMPSTLGHNGQHPRGGHALISKWYVIPEVRMVSQYWDDEGYLSCFASAGRPV